MSENLTNQSWPSDKWIIQKMEEVINKELGRGTWESLTENRGPRYGMNDAELSFATSILTNNFDKEYDESMANKVFSQVRHGLTISDFKWAREKFQQYMDIDSFADAVLEDSMEELKGYAARGDRFYGQLITQEVYDYLSKIDNLFYGKRRGNVIMSTAIPFRAEQYLQAEDNVLKRYYMCHCQFARESIQTSSPVSKTMCYCSMGHVMMFWEAALDTKLTGEVVYSALKGDNTCEFKIFLPEEIIKKYTKE